MPHPSKRLIKKVVRPLHEFLQWESAGGLMLMAAAMTAMLVANTPLYDAYLSFLNTPFTVQFGELGLSKALILWINDGLMAIFFFLVGLELKREVVQGHLSDIRSASLPAFAALGGMAVPALIYSALNHGDDAAMKGWAIPSATDIAFALGLLSLLGNRVPTALKAFLLSVAIFDDLGAIVIIALFYTANLSITSLVVAAFAIGLLALLNAWHVRKPAAYVMVGVVLWVAVLKSGVHATLAGVVLALFVPIKTHQEDGFERCMVTDLEHSVHPWVAFLVLPIFAFANAGVPLTGLSLSDLAHPVPLGIGLGLIVGKIIGVVGMSWLASAIGIAKLPKEMNWSSLFGVALLCGIGFTMSFFIASLAFEQDGNAFQGLERLGILAGSLISGALGYLYLHFTLPRNTSGDIDAK